MSRIPITDTVGISIFNFGENDLVLCRRDAGSSDVSLTMLEDESPSNFSETTIEMKANLKIMEII